MTYTARGWMDENMQQFQQIVELEFENEELKDQMAMMAMEGPVWRDSVAI
jgi:hypothetical protein